MSDRMKRTLIIETEVDRKTLNDSERIVKEFFDRNSNKKMKVATPDFQNILQPIRDIEKEINRVSEKMPHMLGSISMDKQFLTDIKTAFKDMEVMFTDGSMAKGFDEIIEKTKTLSIKSVDLGEFVSSLRKVTQESVNALKEIGAMQSGYSGRNYLNLGSLNTKQLEDSIGLIQQLKEAQQELDAFYGTPLKYHELYSGTSTNTLSNQLEQARSNLNELKRLNLETIQELNQRHNLQSDIGAGEFGRYDEWEFSDVKKDAQRDEVVYKKSLLNLQEYVSERQGLLQQLQNNSRLFTTDEVSEYTDILTKNISQANQQIQELQQIGGTTGGAPIGGNFTEILTLLGEIRNSLQSISSVFQNESASMQTMAANGVSSFNTLSEAIIGVYNNLTQVQSLVDAISQKDFNINNITQVSDGGKSNLQAMKQQMAVARDTMEHLRQLYDQASSTLALLGQNGRANLVAEYASQLQEFSLTDINKSVKGANTEMKLASVLAEMQDYIDKFTQINELRNKYNLGEWKDTFVSSQQPITQSKSQTSTPAQVQSQTQNATISTGDTEAQQMTNLKGAVDEVSKAIGRKNAGFIKEQEIVNQSVEAEKAKLQELVNVIINEIGNALDSVKAKFTQSFIIPELDKNNLQVSFDEVYNKFIELKDRISAIKLDIGVNTDVLNLNQANQNNNSNVVNTAQDTQQSITDESQAAINAAKTFVDAANAKRQFVDANKLVADSAKASADTVKQEADAAQNAGSTIASVAAQAARSLAKTKNVFDDGGNLIQTDATYKSRTDKAVVTETESTKISQMDGAEVRQTTSTIIEDFEKLAAEAKKSDAAVGKATTTLNEFLARFNSKTGGNAQFIDGFSELQNMKVTSGNIDEAFNKMRELQEKYSELEANFRQGQSSLNPFVNAINNSEKIGNIFADVKYKYDGLTDKSQELANNFTRLKTLSEEISAFSQRMKIDPSSITPADFSNFSKQVGEFNVLKSQIEGTIKTESRLQKEADNQRKQSVEEYINLIKKRNEYELKAAKGGTMQSFYNEKVRQIQDEIALNDKRSIMNQQEKNRLLEIEEIHQQKIAELKARQNSLNNFQKQNETLQSKFNAGYLSEANFSHWQNELATYQNYLNGTATADEATIQRKKESLTQLYDHLNKISNATKTFFASGGEILPQWFNTDQINNAEASLRGLYNELANTRFDGMETTIKSVNGELGKLTFTVNDGTGRLSAYTIALNKSTGATKLLGGNTKEALTTVQQFSKALKHDARMLLSSFVGGISGMYVVGRYIRKGIQDVRELDKALTELKKVTDETEETYNKFLDTAAKTGARIGSTLSNVVSATAEFAKLGYNIKEAASMAEAALVYTNVGDNIDVETGSQSIISTLKAFGIEADNTMSIVDKFNEVGNNFAITTKGIGDALQVSASAMAAAGNSLDETIALTTAANTIVQNPNTVGTALKTLSLRIRGVKTELEDAGLETDGMVESTAKLQKEIKALTKGKVDIMLNADTFKNTTQILREMSTVWEEMTDVERARALELLGGKRQANILSAILSNFDIVEDAIEASVNSEGSALEENEKVLNSIQGRINQFTNTLQVFWSNLLNSDAVKFFVTLGTQIIKLASAFGELRSVIFVILMYFNLSKKYPFDLAKWFFGPKGIRNILNGLRQIKNSLASLNTTKTQPLALPAPGLPPPKTSTSSTGGTGGTSPVVPYSPIGGYSKSGTGPEPIDLDKILGSKFKRIWNNHVSRLRDSVSRVKQDFTNLWQHHNERMSQSIRYASGQFNKLKTSATNAFSAMSKMVGNIGNSIRRSFSKLFTSKGSTGVSLIGEEQETTKQANKFSRIWQNHMTRLRGSIGKVKQDFSTIWQHHNERVAGSVKYAGLQFNKLKVSAFNAFNSISRSVSAVVNNIRAKFGQISNTMVAKTPTTKGGAVVQKALPPTTTASSVATAYRARSYSSGPEPIDFDKLLKKNMWQRHMDRLRISATRVKNDLSKIWENHNARVGQSVRYAAQQFDKLKNVVTQKVRGVAQTVGNITNNVRTAFSKMFASKDVAKSTAQQPLLQSNQVVPYGNVQQDSTDTTKQASRFNQIWQNHLSRLRISVNKLKYDFSTLWQHHTERMSASVKSVGMQFNKMKGNISNMMRGISKTVSGVANGVRNSFVKATSKTWYEDETGRVRRAKVMSRSMPSTDTASEKSYSKINEIIEKIRTNINTTVQRGKAAFSTLASSVGTQFNKIKMSITKSLMPLTSGLNNIIQRGKSAFSAFASSVSAQFTNIKTGITNAMHGVSNVMSNVANKARNSFVKSTSRGTWYEDETGRVYRAKVLSKNMPSTDTTGANSYSKINDTIAKIKTTINKTVQSGKESFANLAYDVGAQFNKIKTSISNSMRATFNNVASGVKKTINAISSAFKSLQTKFGKGQSLATAFPAIAGEQSAKTISVYSKIATKVSRVWNNMFTNIGSKFNAFVGKISNSGIAKWVGNIATDFRNKFNGAITSVQNAFGKFSSFVSNVFNKIKFASHNSAKTFQSGMNRTNATQSNVPMWLTAGSSLTHGDLQISPNIASEIDKINAAIGQGEVALNKQMLSYGNTNKALQAYIASLNGGKASMAGFKAYCDAQNLSLKQTGISAFAAQIGVMALQMALSMGLSIAIQFVISLLGKLFNWLKDLINPMDKLTEKLSDLRSEISNIDSELESLNSELETTQDRMAELLALDRLSFTEQEELDNLKKQNDELEREIYLLEQRQKRKQKKAEDTFVKTVKTDLKTEHTIMGSGASLSTEEETELAMSTYKEYLKNAETAKEKLVEAEKKYEAATTDEEKKQANKEVKRAEKEYNKQMKLADASYDSVSKKIEEYLEYADGIDYNLADDDTKELLDYIYNLEDKLSIASGDENAKTLAIKRIFNKDKFAEASDEIDSLVEKLESSPGDDTLINQIRQQCQLAKEDLEAVGLSVEDATNSFTQFASDANHATIEGKTEELLNASEIFEQLIKGSKFTADGESIGLVDLFDKEGKVIQTKLSQIFNDTSEQTRKDITSILEGSYEQIQNGTTDIDNLLHKMGIKFSKQLFDINTSELSDLNIDLFPNLKDEIFGIIDNFNELAKAVGNVADAMDLLEQAEKEEAYSGSVSLETLSKLIEYTDDYSQLIEVDETGAIKLAADAQEILIEQKLKAIKANAQQAYNTALLAVEEIKAAQTTDTLSEVIQETVNKTLTQTQGLFAGAMSLIEDWNNWNFSGAWRRAQGVYNSTVSSLTTAQSQAAQTSLADAEAALKRAEDNLKIANGLTADNVKIRSSSDEASGSGDDTALETLQKGYERQIKNLENQQTQIENEIERLKAEEQGVSADYYEKQITLEKEKIRLYEEELVALKKLQLTDEVADALWETEHAIQESTIRMIELRNSIAELYSEASSNISDAYDAVNQVYDDRKSFIENEISIRETRGEVTPTSAYKYLIDQEKLARQNAQAELNDQEALYRQGIDEHGEAFEGSDEAIEILEKIRQKRLDVQESEKNIADYAEQQKDAYIAYFDKMMEAYSHRNDLIQSQADLGQSYIDRLEALNINIPDEAYKKIAEIQELSNKSLQEQAAFARDELDNLKAQGIDESDSRYIEKFKEVLDLEQQVYEGETKVLEYHQQIIENQIDKFNQVVDRIEHATGQLDNISGLVDGKDVANEDGSWTAEGLTQLGMAYQQMEYNKQLAAEYAEEMEYLDEQFKAGKISEKEYTEQMQELENGQWDAINAYKSAEDAIVDLTEARIDMIEEGLNKEAEAYQELIDLKKEELDAERDLYDFRKDVQKQTKDIAALERRIASMSGSTDAATIAERTRLEKD